MRALGALVITFLQCPNLSFLNGSRPTVLAGLNQSRFDCQLRRFLVVLYEFWAVNWFIFGGLISLVFLWLVVVFGAFEDCILADFAFTELTLDIICRVGDLIILFMFMMQTFVRRGLRQVINCVLFIS